MHLPRPDTGSPVGNCVSEQKSSVVKNPQPSNNADTLR